MSSRAIFGTFDGVHLGHRALFSRAVELYEQDGLTPIAMIIHREGGLITDLEERARLIKATGVSRVEVIPLEGVRHKSAEEFIEHIKEAYGVSAALCGFAFGLRGIGDGIGSLIGLAAARETTIFSFNMQCFGISGQGSQIFYLKIDKYLLHFWQR